MGNVNFDGKIVHFSGKAEIEILVVIVNFMWRQNEPNFVCGEKITSMRNVLRWLECFSLQVIFTAHHKQMPNPHDFVYISK